MPFEQRVVLLERERVDRPHEAQLAVEVAGAPGERGAGGHLRRGRVERDRRFDVVLGAEPLDGGLEAEAGLGLVDVAALQELADFEELLLRAGTGGAELLELIARGGGPLRFGPPSGAPAAQHLVDALGELAQAAADRGVPEPALLERDPVLLGFGPAFGIAGEPVVDLGESLLEHLSPFGELRGAQLQVAPLAGCGRGALVELELHQRTRREQRLRLGRLRFEGRHPHLERGDALDVGGALRLQRLLLGRDGGELHLALGALGLHAGPGPLGAVELVDRAPLSFLGGGFVAAPGVELRAGGVERLARDHARFVGLLGTRAGVVERGAGRGAARRRRGATTPARRSGHLVR